MNNKLTYLEKYKRILLDKLLEEYGTYWDEKSKGIVYRCRGIVYQSTPTKQWIDENYKGE